MPYTVISTIGLVVLLFAGQSPAGAARVHRVNGTSTPGLLPVSLTAVQCSSPDDCVAIGGQAITIPLASIAAQSTDGGAHWASTVLAAGTVQPEALACPTARRCIAVGGSSVGYAPIRGGSLRSLDGGRSWNVLPGLPAGVGQLTHVSCPSPTFCMAVGASTDRLSGVALVTTTFGLRWRRVALPQGEKSLGLVDCTSPRHCIAVGGNPSGSASSIITSSDGGRTWQSTSVPATRLGGGIPGAGGIACPLADRCFIAGDSLPPDGSPTGFILASVDGGTTWTPETMPPETNYLTSISCATAAHCVAVGGGVLPRGGVVRSVLTTSDGGNTWVSRPVPTVAAGLGGVSCPTADVCVAVGGGFASSNPSTPLVPVVLVSSDGGLNWVAVP